MRLLCVALLDGKVQRSEMILQLVESATRMLYRVWWHGGGYRHCLHCLYLYIGTARQRPPLCVHISEIPFFAREPCSSRLCFVPAHLDCHVDGGFRGLPRYASLLSTPRAPSPFGALLRTGVPRNLP
jgi:hypothetical protein